MSRLLLDRHLLKLLWQHNHFCTFLTKSSFLKQNWTIPFYCFSVHFSLLQLEIFLPSWLGPLKSSRKLENGNVVWNSEDILRPVYCRINGPVIQGESSLWQIAREEEVLHPFWDSGWLLFSFSYYIIPLVGTSTFSKETWNLLSLVLS